MLHRSDGIKIESWSTIGLKMTQLWVTKMFAHQIYVLKLLIWDGASRLSRIAQITLQKIDNCLTTDKGSATPQLMINLTLNPLVHAPGKAGEKLYFRCRLHGCSIWSAC
jgi:hypothetical protein